MKYHVNDKGERGVIVSPRYGTGWYSYNGDQYPDCATDPELVRMVLEYEQIRSQPHLKYYERDPGDSRLLSDLKTLQILIKQLADAKWPEGYWNPEGLRVEWVPANYIVTFTELDGSEDIQCRSIDSDMLLIT